MNVGITGHQDLSGFEINWIEEMLIALVADTKPTTGITSLAVGSDQLFASMLYRLRIPYNVIIPCRGYEQTFDEPTALESYRFFLEHANEQILLDFASPNEEAFWAAGKKVVEVSDVIIAIWDGDAAKGLGGTGDVVQYSIRLNKKVYHVNPLAKTTHDIK